MADAVALYPGDEPALEVSEVTKVKTMGESKAKTVYWVTVKSTGNGPDCDFILEGFGYSDKWPIDLAPDNPRIDEIAKPR
jgi:hypothetical protein